MRARLGVDARAAHMRHRIVADARDHHTHLPLPAQLELLAQLVWVHVHPAHENLHSTRAMAGDLPTGAFEALDASIAQSVLPA